MHGYDSPDEFSFQNQKQPTVIKTPAPTAPTTKPRILPQPQPQKPVITTDAPDEKKTDTPTTDEVVTIVTIVNGDIIAIGSRDVYFNTIPDKNTVVAVYPLDITAPQKGVYLYYKAFGRYFTVNEQGRFLSSATKVPEAVWSYNEEGRLINNVYKNPSLKAKDGYYEMTLHDIPKAKVNTNVGDHKAPVAPAPTPTKPSEDDPKVEEKLDPLQRVGVTELPPNYNPDPSNPHSKWDAKTNVEDYSDVSPDFLAWLEKWKAEAEAAAEGREHDKAELEALEKERDGLKTKQRMLLLGGGLAAFTVFQTKFKK